MKRFFFSFFVIAAIAFPSRAGADLIVFGDSLSDVGNFYLASGATLPPTPPYFPGHFSNGPIWVEQLAAHLSLPAPQPSLLGGNVFAFNGAMIVGTSPYGTPDLQTQVGLYTLSLGGNSPALDDIHVLWGGANDIFFSLTGQTPTPVTPAQSVQNLSALITGLAAIGADNFVIPNLPPLGQTPFFSGTPLAAALDAASVEYNTMLAAELVQLESDLGVTIHEVDIFSLFNDVLADPTSFGLTNVTDSATLYDPTTGIGYALAVADPSTYLYFDSVHPTEGIHGLVANQILRFVPEPASCLVWLLIGGVFVACRRRKNSSRA